MTSFVKVGLVQFDLLDLNGLKVLEMRAQMR